METLEMKQGDFVQVSNTRLPSGKLIKIQPQSPDFLEITDPRAVLEFTLRQFTTLSPNDCFWINYADQIFKVKVLVTEPNPTGILVIETDLNVDFAPPVGYIEPDYSEKSTSTMPIKSIAHTLGVSSKFDISSKPSKPSTSDPFSGTGQSLRSGFSTKSPTTTPTTRVIDPSRPVALKLPHNTMFYGISPSVDEKVKEMEKKDEESKSSKPFFQGKGRSLR